MIDFLYLILVSLALGFIGLAAFFWSLGNEQYDDLDGDAQRIFMDD
ncbi:MAG: cbb3-type cytochrome oxidase assembly protein CcoS [Reyranella sp.]|nr:cbb3-type cytochrome oxidase assembly protein CcoS [Reyranella sp.]MDP1963800.1 cbb3-type cytochrome oxidase assembly protein CcoS [Reyranella sp.]MDP2377579.1 cbb3-type cytochrome oxidase assembly protein CcoS [Reyranella sp.]